jgi:uncharacterized protein (TIGR02118 family)
MIRLVYALRRLPDQTREEFQRYWRDQHGPLVARYSTALRIRRYVQTHTLDDPLNDQLSKRRGTSEPFDGLAELWWDHPDELAAATRTPEGRAASKEIFEDERRFIDASRSSLWFAMELPQINPTPENIVAREESTIFKTVFVVRPLPSQTNEEAQLYWRMNHGPVVRSVAPWIRMRRYIQVHAISIPQEEKFRKARGRMEEPYMGHAEAWFDRTDLAAVSATPEGRRGMKLLIQDEAKFIDFSRSAIWASKEHVFIDR